MVHLVRVSTCNLDQWALDFDGNLERTMDSIRQAAAHGSRFRLGPELELSGYGCEDHFLEEDTYAHSWESVCELLSCGVTRDILCDVGMPLTHRGVRYNCRIFLLDSKIIGIRPKLYLANDGNYRETRWFSMWPTHRDVEQHALPSSIRALTGQHSVPIGYFTLQLDDCVIGSETCEELFTPDAPHIAQALSGCDIIANGSGSHHNLRKLNVRLSLMQSAMSKSGGVYLYANQQGCDGGRLYFDGCATCIVNGEVVGQSSQFSVRDLEVLTCVVDLDDVRSYRAAISSRSVQAANARCIPTIHVPFTLSPPISSGYSPLIHPSTVIAPRLHSPEEEIALGPACWLWDYLRRSGSAGYFLPLSGGADSAATCALVGIMCHLVVKAAHDGDARVLSDIRRVVNDANYTPTTADQLAQCIMHTCYMGSSNSSRETNDRAANLAQQVGTYHLNLNIDTLVSAFLTVFQTLTGKLPRYKLHGGTVNENIALQNIQARVRMVMAYLLAQLLPWCRGKNGFLLVLGSANVDEALRGYMTKYDCSSADINPIGGISKRDLKSFLLWASEHYPYRALRDIVSAPPTAELEPITADYVQSDESDMGFTYDELGLFGRLRKIYRCGPVSMYQKVMSLWRSAAATPTFVAKKVTSFFYYYSVNRHKLTTLTPSYHAENYSPDDNRFDHRQFLYNVKWPRQFRKIQELVERDTEILSSSGSQQSQSPSQVHIEKVEQSQPAQIQLNNPASQL